MTVFPLSTKAVSVSATLQAPASPGIFSAGIQPHRITVSYADSLLLRSRAPSPARPPAPSKCDFPVDTTGATQPTVVLAQIEVEAGNPRANVKRMLAAIADAKSAGADVIAFPEMSIAGYMVGDKWLNDRFCDELMMYNEQLLAASKGIAVVWGNIYLDTPKRMAERGITGSHPNEDGRTRRYNAIYVAQDGAWAERTNDTGLLPRGVMSKTLLPNYRFFDDERYFFSTKDIATDFSTPIEKLFQPFLITVNGKRVPIGVECCEDLWCEEYRKDGHALDPTKMLVENGAVRIINISASPWNEGKAEARDQRVLFLKQECGDKFPPFDYVNKVGVQNNGKNYITFDGGSTSYGRDGRPVHISHAAYEPELLLIKPTMTEAVTRTKRSGIAEKHHALIRGIRAMASDKGWLVGMSGGVDSAVVAALLVDAVGADKVKTVNMPTHFNGEGSRARARVTAEKLGIEHCEHSIQEVVDVVTRVNDRTVWSTSKPRSGLNDENLQAKIRGTDFLSNLASRDGMFFSNNGNKLEVALGYGTLYGDWGGALCILGDMNKVEVWQLARYLNDQHGSEIIPAALIPDDFGRFGAEQAAPSAELAHEQVDPMKFYYHDAVLSLMTGFGKATPHDLMAWFADGSLPKRIEDELAAMGVPVANHADYGAKLMQRWGVDEPQAFLADLDWFSNLLERAVFKRVQGPPNIVTSRAAYGYDIRESILPFERDSDESQRLRGAVLEHGLARQSA